MILALKNFFKAHYLTIFILIFGTLILYRPPSDPDFGWHYRYGDYLFNNHSILKENIFSYTLTNYKWANSYWLSELYLYGVSTLLGFVWFPLLNSFVFTCFLVWICYKKCKSTLARIFTLVPTLLLVSIFALVVRPLFFSSIFLLAITYTLLYKPQNTKYFPIIFLVWANMHADFTLGLFIYGVYCLLNLINSLKSHEFNLATHIITPLMSVVATLVNPYTISLWTTILKERNNVQFMNILEWLPLSPKTDSSLLSLVYMFGGLVIAPVVIYKDRKNIWYPCVLVFFFLLSLRSIYFYRVFLLLGVFGLSFFLDFIMNSFAYLKQKWSKDFTLRRLSLGILSVVLLLSVISFYYNFLLSSSVSKWGNSFGFPEDAVNFVKTNKFSGNMFNYYGWGGFLIWQLPEYKTFIDGRMPSWNENGDFLFRDYMAITKNPESNYALFNKYVSVNNIRWVFFKTSTTFADFLLKQPEWKVVYKDSNSLIFIKN